MKTIFVGFRYLAEGKSTPLKAFKTKAEAEQWYKENWMNGWVELDIENDRRAKTKS